MHEPEEVSRMVHERLRERNNWNRAYRRQLGK